MKVMQTHFIFFSEIVNDIFHILVKAGEPGKEKPSGVLTMGPMEWSRFKQTFSRGEKFMDGMVTFEIRTVNYETNERIR